MLRRRPSQAKLALRPAAKGFDMLNPRSVWSKITHRTTMLRITEAFVEPAISHVRTLLREYAMSPGLEACLQDFERELASIPGIYGPPTGRLLLALRQGPGGSAEPVGCAGLRKLEDGTCEMKRLYVRPTLRGEGAGRALVETLISEARAMGYGKMRLDTLPTMLEAQTLYREFGFRAL